MKFFPVLASALIAISAVSGFAADQNAPAAAPATPANAFNAQLRALVSKIAEKVKAGSDTEEDLAPDLRAFDSLIAAHRANKAEADLVADAMYVEGDLYMRVLQDFDKAGTLFETIKNDYPRSPAYFRATEALDAIDLQKESLRIQNALKPGTKFPDFSVTDTSGAPLSIAKFKGKVVLVDFWATWCGPCRAELPNVLAAYSKYHGKGFEIIGVSFDRDEAAFKSFVAEKHMTWPQYFDGKYWDNDLGKKYGVNSIPATYLIGPDGKIIAKNLRGIALDQELAKLLK